MSPAVWGTEIARVVTTSSRPRSIIQLSPDTVCRMTRPHAPATNLASKSATFAKPGTTCWIDLEAAS